MEERLSRLEARLAELRTSVEALESRLAAVEGRAPAAPAAAAPAPAPAPPPSAAAGAVEPLVEIVPGREVVQAVPALVGRTCLVLGGAYLVRALTESGTLPAAAGIAVGLAYAAACALMADRAGGSGRGLGASFHGITSALIAYPLLLEASTRMQALSPLAGGTLTLAFTALLVAVAWRRELAAPAWAGTLGATGVLAALGISSGRLDVSGGLLLALGIGLLWRTYGERWHGLRWAPALAADFSVLLMAILVARPEGPPEAYAGISRTAAFLVAFALPMAYVGSFSLRTLVKKRDVNVFEVLQTLLAIGAGYGGAVRLASASPAGQTALGASALLLGALCYGVAFAFVKREAEATRNFVFYTSLALILLLAGAPLVLSASLAVVFGAAGTFAAGLATRGGNRILALHAAVYLVAAFLVSGLAAAVRDAFTAEPGVFLAAAPGPSVAIVLVLAIGSANFLLSRDPGGPLLLHAGPATFVTLLAASGIAPFAVWIAAGATRLATQGCDAAALSAIRTGVLGIAAVAVAFLSRRTGRSAFAWTSYALLAAGGLKLVLNDVGSGRPATLLWSFLLYGLALVVAPRFLHAPGSASKGTAA